MPPAALPPLGPLLREAFVTPQLSLRRILNLGLGSGDLWLGAALASVLSVVLLYGGLLLSGPGQSDLVWMLPQPFLVAAFQLGLTALMALLTYRLGAIAGGRGGFEASLTAMVWLQLLMVAVQLAQVVVSALIPPLGGLIGLAGIGLFLWLLTRFVAEVHGFRNLAMVFGAVLLTMVAAALVIGVILSLVLGSMMGAG